jgi:hypothetical protein
MKKEQRKALVIIAAVLIFIGLIIIAISQTARTLYIEPSEDAYTVYPPGNETLSNGTSITRSYSIGETISLQFGTKIKAKVLPDLLPVNFLIISPSEKKTNFTYWLKTAGLDKSGYLVLDYDEVEIFEFGGLVPYNSSTTQFVGETRENGNYTLIYLLDTSPIRIGFLSLTKIERVLDYPYASTLPFGIVLAIAGTILSARVLLSLRRPRISHRRKNVDKVKV